VARLQTWEPQEISKAVATRSGNRLASLAGMPAQASVGIVDRERGVGDMIRQYVETALRKARYEKPRDGTFYGAVPRLRGVLATGASLEACRDQLAEVVEEWVLVSQVLYRSAGQRFASVYFRLAAETPHGTRGSTRGVLSEPRPVLLTNGRSRSSEHLDGLNGRDSRRAHPSGSPIC
jgi:predicted RNase H-like HicB family nuclease